MVRKIILPGLCLGAMAWANSYTVILEGKVSMEDGSPPPFQVSVERLCSDSRNGVPGPLVSKKGEWVWRLEHGSHGGPDTEHGGPDGCPVQ
jgi:hypothetical protein